MDDLTKKKSLDDDLRSKLHAALKEYKENFKASWTRRRWWCKGSFQLLASS